MVQRYSLDFCSLRCFENGLRHNRSLPLISRVIVVNALSLRTAHRLQVVVVLQAFAQFRHQARVAAGRQGVHGGEDLRFSAHAANDAGWTDGVKVRAVAQGGRVYQKVVAQGGIEPPTQGFSVLYSTN